MRTNRGFIGVRGLGEAKKRRVAELLHRVFAEHRAGNVRAVDGYVDVLRLDHRHVDAHHLLGVALAQFTQRYEEALSHIDIAIALNGSAPPEFCHNRAVVLRKLGRLDEAIACCDSALAQEPLYVDAMINRSVSLIWSSRPEEAERQAQATLNVQPTSPEAISVLVMARRWQLDYAGAMQVVDRGLAITPEDPLLKFQRSMTLLSMGDIAQGFREYEGRFSYYRRKNHSPHVPSKLWQGQPLAGKRAGIHWEGGIGDMVQMARFFPWAAKEASFVYVAAERPLLRWFQGIPGITAGLIEDELPPVDFWVMAMSLLGAHGVTLDTIPPPITPVHWRPIRRRRLRVGLCWQGGMRLWDPEAVNYDGRRSISLDIFARVLVPGVTYYSLSKDSRLDDRARFDEFRILDVGESFGDFLDTMEFMANELDLVISVDTAIAHAAGTVGVPVWVLCARPHDWRWLQGRDDSPWYPSAKVFRQATIGDWPTVIEQVRIELAKLISAELASAPSIGLAE